MGGGPLRSLVLKLPMLEDGQKLDKLRLLHVHQSKMQIGPKFRFLTTLLSLLMLHRLQL